MQAMNKVAFSYNGVNAVIAENALIDTLRFRVLPFHPSPNQYDSFEIRNTKVLIHNRKPHILNSFRPFNDVQISIAKYLMGGTNFSYDFNDYRVRDYKKHHKAFFRELQADIAAHSGITFDIFRVPASRLHIALNVQCESIRDAEWIRDYLFETVDLTRWHLPNKWKSGNTRYWNCPSFVLDDDDQRKKLTRLDGSLVQANQCFALYPTGNRKLRFEYRRNNAASVQRLVHSSFGASLNLENNFECLSQPQIMNAIFWRWGLPFFAPDVQEKIVKSFSLRNEKKTVARFALMVNV